ncbi:MAG: TIM44-like domain-containing protein [Planctomicrobium sp.]|jgi:uncharacterized tellurite resistance protein B-like protein|nr:TIM44-like domain-containing protein [Planctomicrobium sp.]
MLPNSRKIITRLVLFAVVFTSVICLLPVEAWARAGGGGSFSGGGGGGGSGGSGGSGGEGELLVWLIWLCFKHPVIGIPLLIVLAFFAYASADKTHSQHVTRTIRKGKRHQRERLRTEAIDAIQAHDPEFQLRKFLDRVKVAFEKIQHAWSEQNLSTVRAFISDGIHERFSLQIAMQKSEGYRNSMNRVIVHNIEAVAFFTNKNFDTIHVQVEASAVDQNIDLKTGKPVGNKANSRFVEYWSFHRRPGTKSLSGEGAIEGNCPRCAAQLEVVDRAECQNCGAQVNSGEYDWVLAEITQEQEWNVPEHEEMLPGIPQIMENDPGFNVQHIEDRASVMFWRLKAAEFYNDIKYAEPVVSPKYKPDFSQKLHATEFWKDPAVGKVEIIDAQLGSDTKPDIIRVKVRWSGKFVERLKRKKFRTLRDQAIYTHVYVLVREHGVSSSGEASFTSAGCSNCGAPINVNKEGACVYCGAVLNTGKFDWVLDDIVPYSASLAYQKLQPIPVAKDEWSGNTNDHHADSGLSLAVLAKVMMIDGQFSSSEKQALYRLGAHRNYQKEQIDQIIKQAASKVTNIPTPSDPRQASSYLEQLIHVVLADGQITRQEKKLLQRFASQTGLAEADVKMAINRERKRSYQAAKQELRRPVV